MVFRHEYQKVNSSIVSKGSMNSFNEMLPLPRMFPPSAMHRRPTYRSFRLIFDLLEQSNLEYRGDRYLDIRC